MKLSKEDAELYIKLQSSLLTYTNQKTQTIKSVSTNEGFWDLSIEKKGEIRNAFWDDHNLLEPFVEENPFDFSEDELEIIRGWKNFIKGDFFLVKYLKNHTIFLDDNNPHRAYSVIAIFDTFEEMIGPYLPIMLETVLLPFKGRIIYDGFFSPYSINFGGNIRRSLIGAYQKAKSEFGVITSLPFSTEKVKPNDAELLKFYLKNKRNREIYWEEIDELIDKDMDLWVLYHQEMGKVHARTFVKSLKEIGITNGCFGILEGITVASGVTKDEVEKIIRSIVPKEKRKIVYVFQLKGK